VKDWLKHNEILSRPKQDDVAHAAVFAPGTGSFILGGQPAQAGEFPHQLSQERQGAQWSHSCGASLLSGRYALSAAHCVDGANINILRVIAGLHDRSNQGGSQISTLTAYKMHEQYNTGAFTFNNDIAILTHVTTINAGGNVGFAQLPPDNFRDFAGETVVLSGWGRTSASNVLPNVLQKVSIEVLTQTECNQRMQPVSGAVTGPPQICVFDRATTAGSCNGDSGGPMNAAGAAGSTIVAGVTSWGIQGGGACLPTYPSVYTRTGFFLAWIATNTP
jgi:elastase-2